MNIQSDAGLVYLDTVRCAIRAIVEYGNAIDAAEALEMTVEALTVLQLSPYGLAFAEFTYGAGRHSKRPSMARSLAGIGMTAQQIARVLDMGNVRSVEEWLGEESPVHVQGSPCRRCGSRERYGRDGRCRPCHNDRHRAKRRREKTREARLQQSWRPDGVVHVYLR